MWGTSPLLERLRKVTVGDLRGDCHGCGQSGYCGRCMAVSLIEHGDELGPSAESCRVATAKEMALGLPPTLRAPSVAAREGTSRMRLPVVG